MASLYTHQSQNKRRTFFLFFFFAVIIVLVAYIVQSIYDIPGLLFFAGIFVIVQSAISFWFSDKIVLSISRSKEITKEDNRELYNLVENLCITAGLPLPKIYIIEDNAPNAFATGRNPKNSAIAVTAGLLKILEKSELEGVIAHELSHIGNRDILVMTTASVLVGFLSILLETVGRGLFWSRNSDDDNKNPAMFFVGLVIVLVSFLLAQLIQLAISRKREYLADASGVMLTRYPEGLANALIKISNYKGELKHFNSATAHLFISNPNGNKRNFSSKISQIFSTHPPVEKRIANLLGENFTSGEK